MNKKRICIDISNIIPGSGGSGGGIATYSLNLIKGLNDAIDPGELEIICLKHPDFNGFENCQHIKIVNTRMDNKRLVNRIYWTHLYLPFFCLKHKIQILHRVTPELPAIKVCRYICTLHDLMFDFYLSGNGIRKFLSRPEVIKFQLFRWITKHAAYISNTVIVPSLAIKRELMEKYGTKSDKIAVTYEATKQRNGSDLKAARGTDDLLHIGVVAGFYPHKGHVKILELARQFVAAGFTCFKISFRGSPAFPGYIKEILKMREEFRLNDHIFIVPFDPTADLGDIYSQFDLVLLLSEYEGFGLPVLEAQAYNLPVFCSDIPVFREILSDSAYFIGSGLDNNSNGELIRDLCDRQLLAKLTAAGSCNVLNYSWGKMSNETINLYKNAIKD